MNETERTFFGAARALAAAAALGAALLTATRAEAGVLTVTDDLVMHFDAAVGTYKDNGVTPAVPGDLVRWWNDQATAIAGNNAAQQANAPNQPTLVANAINGLPALRFSGAQNLLVLRAGAGLPSDAVGTALDTDTTTWFIVASKDSPVSTDRLLGVKFGTLDDRWGSFYQTGSYWSHSRNSGGTFLGSGNVVATDTYVVLSAVWDGGHPNDTIEQWINGASGGVNTGANQTGTFDRLRIGASSNGGTNLKGNVAEVLIYNAALSAPDRRSVEDYLYTKYFTSGPPRVNDFPLANNLRLHATADTRDISGSTVLDTVGTPQNGTIVGTVGNPAGTLGQALSFSGSDSNYVDFGNVLDPGTDSYTVSLWFKPSALSGTEYLASKGNAGSGDNGWSIWLSGAAATLRLREASDGRRLQVMKNVADTDWHNLVMVIDRDLGKLVGYLDGDSTGWSTAWEGDTLSTNGYITATNSLLLGRRSTTGAPYAGLIDDFAIWDRALSADEVEYLYTKGLTGFDAATIPEPSSMVLCGIGLALLAARAARRRRP